MTSFVTPDPDGAGPLTASTTSYAYNRLNEVSSITDPLSGVTGFTYDLAGNLLTLDDPVGNTTSWAYDGLGRPTMETNELGHARSFLHDGAGNLTRYTDRNGRVIQYVFDDLDRMTSEKWLENATPAPSVSIATTTQGGSVNEVQRVGYTGSMIMGGTFTLSLGGETTWALSYNATAAQVKSALEALSTVGAGNVDVTQTQSGSFTYEWRVTFQGAKGGTNIAQTTIDATNISSMGGVTDIEATDTTGGLFNEAQTVTLNNTSGGTFRLAFLGQTSAPIAYNASASAVETTLEALNSVDNVTVTGSAGGPWTITFAGSHAGTNVAQMNGDASALTNGTLVRTLSFTYDAASQLTAASDPAFSYSYAYDNLGRTTSESQSITGLTPTVVLASAYDAASNRTSLAATVGGAADFLNSYTFDSLNRLTRVDQTGNGGNAVAVKRVDFAYNALSQFTQISRYQATNGTQNVANSYFSYDTLNRLTDIDHKQGSTVLAAYDLTYDKLHRITSMTSAADGLSSFGYDKTSQLTSADHNNQTDETYSFDANGNRTMTGHTVGSNNRLTSDGTYNYSYDNEGNRTLRTKISDGSKTEYVWDYRNRLVSVIEKNSSNVVLERTDHSYDAFNRWIRRTHDADGAGSGGATDTFFVHDGHQIVLAFDGAAASDLSNRYLWGPAVDQILADEQVTSLSSAGNILWPLTDHLGTTRDLADYNESSGVTSVTNHRIYNAFGLLVSESNSAINHLFGFTGRPQDDTTGLQNNLNRWYDAAIGQWLSEDPLGFLAGDAHLRKYVGNCPCTHLDPFGLFEVPFTGGGLVGLPTIVSQEEAPQAHSDAVAEPRRWGLLPRTIAVGGMVNFGAIIDLTGSAQISLSAASPNILDWRLGYLISGGVGYTPAPNAGVGTIVSVSNAHNVEELNGSSASVSADAGPVVVPVSVGASATNLDPLAGMANVHGHQPTVLNMYQQLSASVEPVNMSMTYGPTIAGSASLEELVPAVAPLLWRDLRNLWSAVGGR